MDLKNISTPTSQNELDNMNISKVEAVSEKGFTEGIQLSMTTVLICFSVPIATINVYQLYTWEREGEKKTIVNKFIIFSR